MYFNTFNFAGSLLHLSKFGMQTFDLANLLRNSQKKSQSFYWFNLVYFINLDFMPGVGVVLAVILHLIERPAYLYPICVPIPRYVLLPLPLLMLFCIFRAFCVGVFSLQAHL